MIKKSYSKKSNRFILLKKKNWLSIAQSFCLITPFKKEVLTLNALYDRSCRSNNQSEGSRVLQQEL